jgi:hypothetical protein
MTIPAAPGIRVHADAGDAPVALRKPVDALREVELAGLADTPAPREV